MSVNSSNGCNFSINDALFWIFNRSFLLRSVFTPRLTLFAEKNKSLRSSCSGDDYVSLIKDKLSNDSHSQCWCVLIIGVKKPGT